MGRTTAGWMFGALALGAIGAAYALRGESADRRSPLALATGLNDRPVLELTGATGTALDLAAHRFRENGVRVVRTPSADAAARILPLVNPDDDVEALVRRRLEQAGFEFGEGRLVHRPGFGVSTDGVVVALTRLVPHHAETDLWSPGASEAEFARVIERLSREAPPMRPAVVVWRDGVRVLTLPTDSRGRAIMSRREVYASTPPVVRELVDDERRRVAGLAEALRGLGLDGVVPDEVAAAVHTSVEAWAHDGPVHGAGRYDLVDRRLEFVRDVPGAFEDALRDLAEHAIVQALGSPGRAWLLDGVVASVVSRASDAPGGGGDPTFEEVVGASPRAAFACERALAALTRNEVDGRGGLAAAWSVAPHEDDAGALRARWDDLSASDRSAGPLSARDAAPMPDGRAVFVGGSIGAAQVELGSARFERSIARIAELGFEAVVLEVHVELAPPAEGERASVPFSMRSWGPSATLEGDGAVRVAVARAKAAGLRVVLWPRYVASPSGPLGSHQNHGNAEGYTRYCERWSLATERVAHLAETVQADALVLFGPADMPLARVLVSDVASEERRADYDALLAARTAGRRSIVHAAVSFRGALIGHVKGLPAVERAAVEARSGTNSVFSDVASRRVGVLVGLPPGENASTASIDGAAATITNAATGLRVDGAMLELVAASNVGEAAAALRDVPFAVFSRWPIGEARGPRFVLTDAEDDDLRALGEGR